MRPQSALNHRSSRAPPFGQTARFAVVGRDWFDHRHVVEGILGQLRHAKPMAMSVTVLPIPPLGWFLAAGPGHIRI